jgi:nucleoside-diphosphate kinase
MNKMQRTVVLVKPDGLQRGLVGQIISRFENKGLKLVGIKMIQLSDSIVETLLSKTGTNT